MCPLPRIATARGCPSKMWQITPEKLMWTSAPRRGTAAEVRKRTATSASSRRMAILLRPLRVGAAGGERLRMDAAGGGDVGDDDRLRRQPGAGEGGEQNLRPP